LAKLHRYLVNLNWGKTITFSDTNWWRFNWLKWSKMAKYCINRSLLARLFYNFEKKVLYL